MNMRYAFHDPSLSYSLLNQSHNMGAFLYGSSAGSEQITEKIEKLEWKFLPLLFIAHRIPQYMTWLYALLLYSFVATIIDRRRKNRAFFRRACD